MDKTKQICPWEEILPVKTKIQTIVGSKSTNQYKERQADDAIRPR